MTWSRETVPSKSPSLPRIALVGDDAFQLEQWGEYLGKRYDVCVCHGAHRALRRFEEERFQVVVIDMQKPGLDAASLLERLNRTQETTPTVIVTDPASEAVDDTLELGPNAHRARAIRHSDALRREIDQALARPQAGKPPEASPGYVLYGESPVIKHVRNLIERFAASNLPVMLLGASGTGKELAARALHAASTRAAGPFVAVNCAALSESLIDSELFGHERGAFTGAQSHHQGLFDSADGGTLFLDEIGDVPLPTQVRLLRTLQEGEVRPVGATRCHHVDVRVISATNIDMKRATAEGGFRPDLYFRLSPIKIEMPLLRDRGRDILLVAEKLLGQCAARARRRPPSMSAAVLQSFLSYDWPGNVRELKSAIEYALSLARGEQIEVEDLPPSIGGDQPKKAAVAVDPDAGDDAPPPNYAQNRKQWLADFDRRYFEQLMRYTRGNISEASRHSGVDRSNLRRILKDIGLNAVNFRSSSRS